MLQQRSDSHITTEGQLTCYNRGVTHILQQRVNSHITAEG